MDKRFAKLFFIALVPGIYPDAHATTVIDPSMIWLIRPWEIRYVIFISDEHSRLVGVRWAAKENRKRSFAGRLKSYLDAQALLRRNQQFSVPGGSNLATVVVRFAADGRVLSGVDHSPKWMGKRNVLDKIVLVPGNQGFPLYSLATWSQGIPGDLGFSPAVCGIFDNARYQGGWRQDDPAGNFGCREWTYQLSNRDRPYIDVTTYRPEGNFIGEFVGWARFEDPRKPVIGQHGKTWLCLHECPAGEKPGPIKDMQAWTAKHGFEMPEPPAKQPQFPNKDYLDDIREEFKD